MPTEIAKPPFVAKPIAYSIADDRIKELASIYMPLAIEDVADAEAFQQVRDARITIRDHRIDVEKTRVELKAEALKYGRLVDSEAKRLTGMLEPIEKHLQAEEDKVTEAKEKIRREKEQVKLQITQRRMDAFAEHGAYPNPALVAELSDEHFAIHLKEAADKHAAKIKVEQEVAAEKARLQKIESDRIAAERAELEKARAEEAERRKAEAKALAEQRAELERQRAECDKIAAEQRAEAGRLAAAKLALEQAETARRRAEELEKARAEVIERTKAEAEERRRREEEAAKARLAAEEAERRRIEAMRPDREKLLGFAVSLKNLPVPEVSELSAVARRKVIKIVSKAAADIRVAVSDETQNQ